MVLSSNWPKLGYWFSCSSHTVQRKRELEKLYSILKNSISRSRFLTASFENESVWQTHGRCRWNFATWSEIYGTRVPHKESPGRGIFLPFLRDHDTNLPKHILCFYRVIKHFEWEFSRVRKKYGIEDRLRNIVFTAVVLTF